MSERGFLGRWSGRKRAAREEERRAEEDRAKEDGAEERQPDAAIGGDVSPAEAGPFAEAPAAEEAEISEEELARLPPVEEAQSSTDLRPYLRRGVPPALRRAALRRMWSLNPAIRDYVDPALDYAWDFNAASGGQAAAAAGVARLLGSAVRQVADAPPSGRAHRSARAAAPSDVPSGDTSASPSRPASPAEAVDAGAPDREPERDEPSDGTAARRRRHGAAVPRQAGQRGPAQARRGPARPRPDGDAEPDALPDR
jgi:hypothetical protein